MFKVFVDESGADGGTRFLVHGALFVRSFAVPQMWAAVRKTLDGSTFPDELKWSTTSKRRLTRDLEAISSFFSHYSNGSITTSPRFQSLVADQHRLNVRKFHRGNAEMCFYKLLYPLLVKRILAYAKDGEEVHVVLDHRTTKNYDLEELRSVLQHGLQKCRISAPPIVRTVEYRDSKNEPLLQIADFLSGAVCFHQNGRHLGEGVSKAKVAAAHHIATRIGASDLSCQNRWDDRFGIWNIRLKK